jgi:PIN domain nuclease of toxin-antitoxin system
MMDVLRLDIGLKLELIARAYAATCRSACWWWPHKDWVLVSERPNKIEIKNNKLVLAQWSGWEVSFK